MHVSMAELHIVTIVGARPQFVKASAMSRALKARGSVREIIVHTGQHYDSALSDVFFEELEIPRPEINLGVGSGPHGAMTGRIMEAVEAFLMIQRPDAVLVFGDTNSTLGGALAAAKLGLPVIHLEAGMRSGVFTAPEEINRIAVDHLSALLLCSTGGAAENLQREGLRARTHIVGDVMYDVTLFARERSLSASNVLQRYELREHDYDVLTLHRAENIDDPARRLKLLDYVVRTHSGRQIVFPIHPRTRKALGAGSELPDGLTLIEPLGYFDFHRLLAGCGKIYTDSGGVQKEAYFHRKQCVTLRDETEWNETIEAGWNRLWTQHDWRRPQSDIVEYGEGKAAQRAAAEIVRFLG
jgi:UDP-GlcNAc3NAcA epimerase